MSRRKCVSTVALVAIALIAACSGDSTTQPGGDLSTEQLQSMTTVLSFLLGLSLGTSQSTLSTPTRLDARSLTASVHPITGSLACPEGGRVGVTGTLSSDSAGDAIFALTDTLVDCGIKDNHSNVWTFTSKPTMAVNITELTNIHGDSIDISHFTNRQTDVGAVRYSTGAQSGRCSVDVSIERHISLRTPTADSATLSLHTTGTVCGHAVRRDTSVTTYSPPPS